VVGLQPRRVVLQRRHITETVERLQHRIVAGVGDDLARTGGGMWLELLAVASWLVFNFGLVVLLLAMAGHRHH
jgi:hypothetical protein